jgi:hypothetical protein
MRKGNWHEQAYIWCNGVLYRGGRYLLKRRVGERGWHNYTGINIRWSLTVHPSALLEVAHSRETEVRKMCTDYTVQKLSNGIK